MTTQNDDDRLRPHSYDGIREFDKRLPNWWLFTLYITIVFWVAYWSYYEWLRVGPSGPEAVNQQMARIEATKLASAATLDDATLWRMSRSPEFVTAGETAYMTYCQACHLPSLRGKEENPTAIGPNLVDTNWIHGGNPMDLVATVTDGVLVKGMPPWGPVLGERRITEVVAFVLSHHEEGEPVNLVPSESPTTP